MKFAVLIFFGMCFFGGCMLSKMRHDEEVEKFDIKEPEISQEEIENILNNA